MAAALGEQGQLSFQEDYTPIVSVMKYGRIKNEPLYKMSAVMFGRLRGMIAEQLKNELRNATTQLVVDRYGNPRSRSTTASTANYFSMRIPTTNDPAYRIPPTEGVFGVDEELTPYIRIQFMNNLAWIKFDQVSTTQFVRARTVVTAKIREIFQRFNEQRVETRSVREHIRTPSSVPPTPSRRRNPDPPRRMVATPPRRIQTRAERSIAETVTRYEAILAQQAAQHEARIAAIEADTIAVLQGAMTMIHDLMTTHLNAEQRAEMMEKHSNCIYSRKTCTCCQEYKAEPSDITKCIHSSCPGLCRDCHSTMGDTCPACYQTQEIECPICFDTKKADEMMMSNHCSHGVCIGCYNASCSSGLPIEKCPMCRVDM